MFQKFIIYGHKVLVLTKRMALWNQVAEMSFLDEVAALSLEDWVRSSAIFRRDGGDSLLLHIERSQIRWLRHMIRMPSALLLTPPGQSQDKLEGSYLSSGLGIPLYLPEGGGGGGQAEGSPGLFPLAPAPATETWIS